MSEFFTPEHNEKFLEECIAKLRTQIAHEQEDHHHHIGWIEYNCRRQIRDAQLDFADRVETLRRELDALMKAATLKHAYSTVPPVIVDDGFLDRGFGPAKGGSHD